MAREQDGLIYIKVATLNSCHQWLAMHLHTVIITLDVSLTTIYKQYFGSVHPKQTVG